MADPLFTPSKNVFSSEELLNSNINLPQVTAMDNTLKTYTNMTKPLIKIIVGYAGIFSPSSSNLESVSLHGPQNNQSNYFQYK